MTMKKKIHYQLEAKVNKTHMTQLLLIPTSPPNQMKKFM
jgi:hypothetical protein